MVSGLVMKPNEGCQAPMKSLWAKDQGQRMRGNQPPRTDGGTPYLCRYTRFSVRTSSFLSAGEPWIAAHRTTL